MRLDIAILYYALRAAGLLPLRLLHAFGSAGGAVLGWLPGKLARHTAINLSLVHPELDHDSRRHLRNRILRQGGQAVAELALVWGRGADAALAKVREVRGRELLDRALADDRGLVIAAPHLGCWELLNHWLCQQTDMAILYRPPRMVALEPLLRLARGSLAPRQLRADGSGVRELFRCLAAGGTVGVLPDQEPRRGDGRFARFFGVPALTGVLLPRLAARTNAQVLFAWAERLPRGRGFRIHVRAAPEGIADADLDRACGALNLGVEECVGQAFDQYQWHYKRFRAQPDGNNPYRREGT